MLTATDYRVESTANLNHAVLFIRHPNFSDSLLHVAGLLMLRYGRLTFREVVTSVALPGPLS